MGGDAASAVAPPNNDAATTHRATLRNLMRINKLRQFNRNGELDRIAARGYSRPSTSRMKISAIRGSYRPAATPLRSRLAASDGVRFFDL